MTVGVLNLVDERGTAATDSQVTILQPVVDFFRADR